MKTDKELQTKLEDMGLSPWDIEKWMKCPHVEFRPSYTITGTFPNGSNSNITKDKICIECKVPKSVWDEANGVREIVIPICEFGKKLDLKEIIEIVEYIKGDKNNIGDAPDDYVRIVIRDD